MGRIADKATSTASSKVHPPPAPENAPLSVEECADQFEAAAVIAESKRLAREAIAKAAAR